MTRKQGRKRDGVLGLGFFIPSSAERRRRLRLHSHLRRRCRARNDPVTKFCRGAAQRSAWSTARRALERSSFYFAAFVSFSIFLYLSVILSFRFLFREQWRFCRDGPAVPVCSFALYISVHIRELRQVFIVTNEKKKRKEMKKETVVAQRWIRFG